MQNKTILFSLYFIFFSSVSYSGDIVNAIGKTINAASYLKPRNVFFKGTLRVVHKDLDYPVKMKNIQLLKGEKLMGVATSSLLGDFQFFIKLSNGIYTLKSTFNGFDCIKKIEISKSNHRNIQVKCEKTK